MEVVHVFIFVKMVDKHVAPINLYKITQIESVDPDKLTHYEQSHVDLCFLQRFEKQIC